MAAINDGGGWGLGCAVTGEEVVAMRSEIWCALIWMIEWEEGPGTDACDAKWSF